MARSLDSLSASVDPASLAETRIRSGLGASLGVAVDTRLFEKGNPAPVRERHGRSKWTGWDVATATWSTVSDGVPSPGKKYVIEMRVALFVDDVDVRRDGAIPSGLDDPLWSATFRQAEE